MIEEKFSILGGGNLGSSIAIGLKDYSVVHKDNLLLYDVLEKQKKTLESQGFRVAKSNREAVREADIILIAVKPYQVIEILEEIKDELDPERHIIISSSAGISSTEMYKVIDDRMSLFRVMPNIAIAVQEAASCITPVKANEEQKELIHGIFSSLGDVHYIPEHMMSTATVASGCGIAFVMRFLRAMTAGSVEMGFQPSQALEIATKLLRGAAELLEQNAEHPEHEIDKVATPLGITITGLNEMEHNGFSSAVIKGIMKSYDKVTNGK
ncbi:MAG: pyrroline-5-carboxylate reductase [Bacteroidota bacterium]